MFLAAFIQDVQMFSSPAGAFMRCHGKSRSGLGECLGGSEVLRAVVGVMVRRRGTAEMGMI
jgi:hypothetical protein